MNLKRGQTTIFIIISVVIIGAAAAFFALRGGVGFAGGLSPEGQRVYNFVQSCVQQVGTDAVYAIGYRGGYYVPPNFSIEYGIPYYYANNKSYMPQKQEIENQISNFVGKNLNSCVKNFSELKDLNITSGSASAEAKIQSDKVVLSVNYPLTVYSGKDSATIKTFGSEIPVRLGTIYDSVESIIGEQLTHDSICLSCVLDASLKNDLYASMDDYGNSTVIFSFRDENSKINNQTFEFVFANKY